MSTSMNVLFRLLSGLVTISVAALVIFFIVLCACVALILPPLIAVTQWRTPRSKEYWLVVAATTTTLVLGSASVYDWHQTGNPQYAVTIFILYGLGALAFFIQKNCEEIRLLDAMCVEY